MLEGEPTTFEPSLTIEGAVFSTVVSTEESAPPPLPEQDTFAEAPAAYEVLTQCCQHAKFSLL